MEKLSWRELKAYLSEATPDDLRLDILTLFKEVPAVKEYYLAKLVPHLVIFILSFTPTSHLRTKRKSESSSPG